MTPMKRRIVALEQTIDDDRAEAHVGAWLRAFVAREPLPSTPPGLSLDAQRNVIVQIFRELDARSQA